MRHEIGQLLLSGLFNSFRYLVSQSFSDIPDIRLGDNTYDLSPKGLLHIFNGTKRGIKGFHHKAYDNAQNQTDNNAHGTSGHCLRWINGLSWQKGRPNNGDLLRLLSLPDECLLVFPLQQGGHVIVRIHPPL